MASVSAAGHTLFLEALEDAIRKIRKVKEDQDAPENMLAGLQSDIHLLEEIYTEYDHAMKHLKQLVSLYNDTHRKARIDLRIYRHKYVFAHKCTTK